MRRWGRCAASWSIRFGFHLFREGQLTVYPRENRILNIGGDGSGVHGARGFPFNTALCDGARPVTPGPVREDPRIVRAAARLYGGPDPLRRAARRLAAEAASLAALLRAPRASSTTRR